MSQANHDSLGGVSSGPATNGLLSSQQWAVAGLAAIVVAIFIAYWPAVDGALIWNDSDYVTRPEMRSLHGLVRIWFDVGATEQYYPLLHSFFWVQSQLWGDWPVGPHVVNLLLHAAAVCLLYLILRRLQIPGALLAAAIFALHPVMVESVAWITEQKNTLSTVFYLASLLVYLRFDQTRRASLYAAALALFVLAIFSKTVTATLPAALLVIFWWQRGALSWRRDVLPLLPWFVLAIVGGLFTAWVERNFVGAEGALFALSPLQRCLIAGWVPWFYASKLFWPVPLIFMYPRWNADPAVWWQWLFPLGTVGMCVALWLVRRRSRGPLAAWLLFIGTLVPVLGFLNVYWFVFSFAADHLQYLASLALIVLAAAAIAKWLSDLQPDARWGGNLMCIAMLGALGTLTWRQAHMYSDVVTLYQTTIDQNPTCWLAYNNLGITLASAGRLEEAIANFQKSLQLRPDNSRAHNNLGSALAGLGRQQEAIAHYRQALVLKSDFPEAHNNLGIALVAIGQTPQAIEEFKEAVRLDSNFAEAHNNLGAAFGRTGQFRESIAEFEQALRGQPNNIQIYTNMMAAYAALQQPADVIHTAQKASELAQAQGQTALVQQIAAWLNGYRASLSDPAGKRDQSGKASQPESKPQRP